MTFFKELLSALREPPVIKEIDALTPAQQKRYRDIITMAEGVLAEAGLQVPKIDGYYAYCSRDTAGFCRIEATGSIFKHRVTNIAINLYNLDERFSENEAIGTLIHELLHAMHPGEHHEGGWLEDARLLAFEYPQYGNIVTEENFTDEQAAILEEIISSSGMKLKD